MIGFLLQFFAFGGAVVLVSWAGAKVLSRFLPDEEYDPNANYDWDQEPFGGELR